MEQNRKGFSQKNVFWIAIALAVLGQIAWGLENSWFNTFTYDEITTNTQPIAIMNGASAIVATVTTFLMGTLSDKAGKRKPFILWGYVIWGIATAGFYCCKLFPGEFIKCLMVVVLDCVMTFFGSTAYDSCFNAWTTDISNKTNRGRITAIVQIAPLISGVILAFAGAVIDNYGYAVFFISVGSLVSLTGLIAGNAMKDAPDLRPNADADKEGVWKQIFGSFKIDTFKKNKKLFLVLCIVCILLCGFQVSYAYEMIFANQYLGISKTYATFLTAAALPVMVIASLWTGRLCDQSKGTKVLCIAPILFIAGCLLHGSTANIILIILARVLLYGGWMAIMVASTAMFKNLIPEDSHGRFEGMRMIFMVMIPMVVGPEIGSLLIGSGNVAPIIYIVSGIVTVFAYLPIVFLVRMEKKEII
ncbi:MAG: MFS transporter [Solobacterium sp.]|jgi:MFS family permease|nr:MFS transporter [Solobacterium sp.]MCH4205475.1 MFS transporter [Solobacterium sp.]MCH4226999.1 MFS transporter [Solobacterium sp.]MCH4282162.1 MFS transporter [Solobacterium sp.]